MKTRYFGSILLMALNIVCGEGSANQLFWQPFPNDLQSVAVFGANQPITIGWGSIDYLDKNILPDVCPDGQTDRFNAFADIYVVPAGSVSRNSTTRLSLSGRDVSGSVNTVEQFLGVGYFLDEPIGATGSGSGGVGVGKYAVIYDECQDGFLDSEDYLLDPAFEVRADVPVFSGNAISEMKQAARNEGNAEFAKLVFLELGFSTLQEVYNLLPTTPKDISLSLSDILKLKPIQNLLKDFKTLSKLSNVYTSVQDNDFVSFYQKFLAGRADQLPSSELEVTLVDFPNDNFIYDIYKGTIRLISAQRFSRYYRIAADPPDSNYKQLAAFIGRVPVNPGQADSLLQANADLTNVVTSENGLLQAFVTTMERYQGAQAAGDADWALIQARQLKRYAQLLVSQLAQTNAELTNLGSTFAADLRPLDDIAGQLESFRARVAAEGFSAAEKQAAARYGVTSVQLGELRSALTLGNFAFTKADISNALQQSVAANNSFTASLNSLATYLDTLIAQLEINPLASNKAPRASLNAAASGQIGSALALTGSASTSTSPIVAYDWNLDGDGNFNDARGATPSYTPTAPYTGLMGLKVTNSDGFSDIAYAPLIVPSVNRVPVLSSSTPAARSLELALTQTANFQVAVSDPDSDVVNIEWRLDGQAVGTGASFAYTAGDGSIGVHAVEALVKDDSPENGTVWERWAVAVQAPADAADVAVSQIIAPETANIGVPLTYTITLTNNGPATATQMKLTDTLPAGVTVSSVTSDQGTCTQIDDQLTCNLDDLEAGRLSTVTLAVTPNSQGVFTNTAVVSADPVDPVTANNTDRHTVSADYAWVKHILDKPLLDGWARGIAVGNNSVYVTGEINRRSDGSSEVVLGKYDKNGNLKWVRYLRGSNVIGAVNRGRDAAMSPEGGVYIVGSLASETPLNSPSLYDAFIRKFDQDGNEL